MGRDSIDIIVLGAGLSGLGLAWHIKEKKPKIKIRIIEEQHYVGGLAASVPFEGKYFLDFGPHFFTVEKDETLSFIRNILNNDLLRMERHCLLYFNNRYLSYPPTLKNVIFELGLKTSILSCYSYAKSKMFPPKKFKSFEDWSIYNFGEHLHNIFFKPYTENFWGIKSNKLASKWAETRISRMNLLRAIMSLFMKSVSDTSINRDKLPLHYPRKGVGHLPRKIAGQLKNTPITLNSKVKKIKINKGNMQIICVEKGNEKKYKCKSLVSTIPVTHLINIIEPRPPPHVVSAANRLKFRSLIVMHMITKKKNVLKAPYVYYHDHSYHRLTESCRISNGLCPKGENSIFVEKSCFVEDDIWKYGKKKLFNMFIEDMEKDGILGRKDVIKTFLLKKEHVYPVYNHNFQRHLKTVNDYIEKIVNLKSLGRPGEFLYLDMDQSLERSFNVAEKILKNIK